MNSSKSKKRGRIIIRNLAYKANEETIRNVFQSYGNIEEIAILKLPDGKAKGVAFLQYGNSISALKAIKECNMKPLLGRPIAVDLAVPKNKYLGNMNKDSFGASKVNTSENVSNIMIKEEDIKSESIEEQLGHNESNESLLTPKKESGDTLLAPKKESWDNSSEMEGSINDDELYSENDLDSDRNSEDDDISESDLEEPNAKKMKGNNNKPESSFSHNPVSKDVMEGKTIFLRNLSFQITEQEVVDVLSKYGSLKYVVFCKDKQTQQFKGSAFAQFMSKEAANKCIEDSEDPLYKEQFSIGGRRLVVARAVGRGEVAAKGIDGNQNMKKKKEGKDKRNIYLAREGVIREGTKAAIGVSKSDLALRRSREIVKRRMLANFNTLVSPYRLFICNLPLHIGDNELKSIFKNHTSDGAVITECRIMRNLFELDDSGFPLSKGHGFVAFKEHRHALEALRSLNNNPNVFENNKRPVVEFSLENKAALQAKENRLKISKERNKEKKMQFKTKEGIQVSESSQSSSEPLPFMGSKYDPKRKGLKALHSHIGPKIRHRDRAFNKDKSEKEGKITRNQMNHQLQRSRKISNKKMKSKKQGKSKPTHGKGRKEKKGKQTAFKKTTKATKGKKRKFIQ